MPKLTDKHSRYVQQTIEYQRVIGSLMGALQMSQTELARKMDASPSKICRNLKDLDSMSFRDVRTLGDILGFKIVFEGEMK